MSKSKYVLLWAMLHVLLASTAAHALPPPRHGYKSAVERFLATGRIYPDVPKEVREYRRLSPSNGKYPYSIRASVRQAPGIPLAISTSGAASVRPLVILVDFVDRQAVDAPAVANPAVFDNLYFGSGPKDLSVKNYWEEVSYTRQGTNLPGRSFTVNGTGADIVGWLHAGWGTDSATRIPTSITSIANIAGFQPGNIRQLLSDAVSFLAGRGFDFSPYVRPSDNTLQAVILHHPGHGQEDTDNTADPYSHMAGIASIDTGAGSIVDYMIVPSLQAPIDPELPNPAVDNVVGIGVVVHEMGHLLGLPDLYPTLGGGITENTFSGVGIYDLMGYGMWGSDLLQAPGRPAHPSAWSKAELGWVVPTVQEFSNALLLAPVEYLPEVHLVFPNSQDPGQWFLVENRQTTDVTAPSPPWLFDNRLPGSGILIWHIDNLVVAAARPSNTVNNDNLYKGVDLEEANGLNLLGQPITGENANDRAKYFGQLSDFFREAGRVFSRELPVPGVNETNSTPIFGVPAFVSAGRPPDIGDNVTFTNFKPVGQTLGGSAVNFFLYDLTLSGTTGGGAPAWKTFNQVSTGIFPLDNTLPRNPMRSDDILSLAFDSANNVWMGTRDSGIFRFLGTSFDFLDAADGIPSSPIRAMAFEDATGSMFVGMDNGVVKVSNAGAGFRVQPFSPAVGAVIAGRVQAIAVKNVAAAGRAMKYVGTRSGLFLLDDGATDSPGDDFAQAVLTAGPVGSGGGDGADVNGDVTALAIDNTDDILWVGFSNGVFARSRVSDPLRNADFWSYRLAGSNRVSSLFVDKRGILWIGTNGGVQAFDLGDLFPGKPNFRDPYDFNGDRNLEPDNVAFAQVQLGAAGGLASDNVTGVTGQVTNDKLPVVWTAHFRDDASREGGVSRIDMNDNSVTVFRYRTGVPPEDMTDGPPSAWVSAAAADTAGNVWFGTTVGNNGVPPGGASRFGNAGIISLDSAEYINYSARATVTLQDDGLNNDNTAVEQVKVIVFSGADKNGIFVVLTETGADSGIFTGRFTFTAGTSSSFTDPPVLKVTDGTSVDVSYFDHNPLGVKHLKSPSIWRAVFPFEDNWLVGGFSCFVATAAYGSPMAPEVRTFRLFRDRVLLGRPAGRWLVSLYYRASPPLAEVIARHEPLRAVARALLAPAAVGTGFVTGSKTPERTAVLLLLAVPAGLVAAFGGRRNRRGRVTP